MKFVFKFNGENKAFILFVSVIKLPKATMLLLLQDWPEWYRDLGKR